MKIFLILLIPAIWAWAITLSLEIRGYFNYALYQDFKEFTMLAVLFFPILAILCTYIIVQTIKQLSESE